MLYLGVIDNAKINRYDDICYVRIEAFTYTHYATEEDKNVFLSIKDHDGTIIVPHAIH